MQDKDTNTRMMRFTFYDGILQYVEVNNQRAEIEPRHLSAAAKLKFWTWVMLHEWQMVNDEKTNWWGWYDCTTFDLVGVGNAHPYLRELLSDEMKKGYGDV